MVQGTDFGHVMGSNLTQNFWATGRVHFQSQSSWKPKPPASDLPLSYSAALGTLDHVPGMLLTWASPQTRLQGACMEPLSSWSLSPDVWEKSHDKLWDQQRAGAPNRQMKELPPLSVFPPSHDLLGRAPHDWASVGETQINDDPRSSLRSPGGLLKLCPVTHALRPPHTGDVAPKR